MKHRVYLPSEQTPDTDADVTLDAETSHYLCRVLRLRANDELLCFDGNGTERRARVRENNPRRCTLALGDITRTVATPTPDVTLIMAMLKGDALDRALQRATETGVSRIRLAWTDRSEVKLSGQRLSRKLDHWRKVVASSCEQSGRVFTPEVSAPAPLLECLTGDTGAEHITLDARGGPFPKELQARTFVLLVGPEGGFSEVEQDQLAKRCRTYRLGHTTLRAETVPAAALGALFQATGWPDC